jgi:general secretion pathway protein A
MYTEFYRLKGLPFQLTPDPRFFFSSAGHARAMAHLTYGLHQGEGFIVITGEVGAGKTTLVDLLLSQLDTSAYAAAKIVTSQLQGDDLLRMVAAAFGLYVPGMEKAAMLRRIEDFIHANMRARKRSLILIDEAQNLSIGALEELRMLSNFARGGTSPVQSFLVGQPQFRNIMASPELDQLRQRVIASYHLGPMTEVETKAYVLHRLKTVEWKDDPVLGEDAFGAIYRFSEGVPRRINTLASRLLLFGYLEERHALDADAVTQVAEELQSELSPVGGTALSSAAAHDAVPRGNGTDAMLSEIMTRVAAIEQTMGKHERTIKRALEIIASYVRGAPPQ